jgi:hypothetical protein
LTPSGRRALGPALAARRWPLLLLAVAAAPFVPGAVKFLRHGVTDVMFSGDGAVLELRTLQAAHGRQLLGPYSRFHWSHPGPAFFYLALPLYQLFHQRGAALNLFVLIANFAAATMLVWTARRLRGDLFALAVAMLLAVYETVAAPFPLSWEWNPVTPILPLALLVFLCVRLGTGGVGALPAVAFVASAMVQTHLGFTPATLFLVATGTLFCFHELFVVRTTVAEKDQSGVAQSGVAQSGVAQSGVARPSFARRRVAISLAVTAIVSMLLWVLPLYEDLTRPKGNLHLLGVFCWRRPPAEHSWRVAVEAVSSQLAIFPLALCHALGRASMDVGMTGRHWLAAGQAAAVVVGLVVALRRRDQPAALLSAMTLGLFVVAIYAVREIPGEILDHLVAWVSVLGFVAWAAVAAALVPAAGGHRPLTIGVLVVALPLLALTLLREDDKPIVPERDLPLERLTAEVETFLHRGHIDRLRLEIAAHDEWPRAAGLVVTLAKDGFDVTVTDDWLFMFGSQLASGAGALPALVVADATVASQLRVRPAYELIATADETSVFLRPGPRR